ncbi:hypothetical protein TRFO_28164 [Tritrichomonas foetus]|uniref:Myb-like DNA-binding domain containing protein n=1 Tax=Tritrichomonas foetus TaxID=1144522 RepID=A0A1J4JZD6_9EUKA|nr:hypothetical protein TRFO_28164 [Tritrichomonas foetus]|eukprot:OHT04339.1 hypothetical protein TRFO_28164 [Tritrichomonas foetus]
MFPGPIFIIETEVTQRNRFSKEEDEQLKALVGQYDEPDWKKIASCLKSRSPRQCRERYNNYLRPDLINGPWSPEEEDLLIEKYEKYGPKWSTIVKYSQTTLFSPRLSDFIQIFVRKTFIKTFSNFFSFKICAFRLIESSRNIIK